jgi:lipopolysaccharide export system permease protein
MIQMKIIDKYILKQFLFNIIFGIIAFICLFIIVDLMENLDKFIDAGVKYTIVIKFYINFIPEIVKLILPVAMLLASLFTTGKLSSFNEITAMKSNGISAYRIMLPFIITAFILSGAAIYFNGWIVPSANKTKYHIDRVYMHRHLESINKDNIFLQDNFNTLMCLGYFDDNTLTATRVSIQIFSDTNTNQMLKRYDSQIMKFDTLSKKWILYNAIERKFNEGKEKIYKYDTLSIKLNFQPYQILKEQQKPDEMNYYEMSEFISAKKRSGYNMSKWLVEFYNKISYPFASFIVVLFGVPFAINKRRAGMSVQFGISLFICFIYFVFMKVSNVFGYNGDIHPLLTSWLANIVFFIAAIINLIRIKM